MKFTASAAPQKGHRNQALLLCYCTVTPQLSSKLKLKNFLDKVRHFNNKKQNEAHKSPTFKEEKKSPWGTLNIDLCHNSWTVIPCALIFLSVFYVKKGKAKKSSFKETMVTDHFYPSMELSK